MICLSNVISNADDILRIFDLNPVVVSSSINAYNEHEIPNCSSYYETYCYNSTITSYQQNFFVERNKILQVKSYVDLVSNMVNALTDNFIDYFFVNRTDKEVEEAIGIINERLFNADLVPSILLKNTSISDTKINFNKIINIVIAKHVELWSEQKTNELFKNIVVNCYDKCWASYLAFILWLKDFAPNHNTESSTPLEFFNRTCADFYEEFKRNVIFCVIENINKDNSEKINDELHLAFCTLLKQINVEQKVYDEYVNKYNNSKQQAKQNESGKRIDVAFKPNGEVEIISSMDFKENKPLSPELQRVLKGALQNIYGRMVRLKKSPNNKDDDEKK